ncbi:SDR family NAD(P)-dependent oxidoreductase [Streptomyces sp. BV129]|uniref:SDR family NAD(P)-dependent oxidoreductase n=1 Tax=Streptomyces sp. BV129 TaxID=2849671 RepID=UPI001C2E10DB|nr:SDR family oxidoreductase [Streptomyces sp. BV129]MBV1947606.1 SDR family oxidoreductase [Streptomyces sp. BV129]
MGKLDGKTAVVTGGSSGIGLATAKLLADEGAYVFVTGRRPAELAKVEAEIGANVTTVQGDISDLDDLDRLWARVREERGSVDVIVANAAHAGIATLAETTPEQFDALFDTNARGTFFTVQKALPLLNEGGSVVLISSTAHLIGASPYTAYSASKAAVRSFARSWADELKERGVRVNSVSPGPTDTPIIETMHDTQEGADAMREDFRQALPMARLGRPEEVAAAVLFLASDDSSFTTGADLVVDGGQTQL